MSSANFVFFAHLVAQNIHVTVYARCFCALFLFFTLCHSFETEVRYGFSFFIISLFMQQNFVCVIYVYIHMYA